MIKFIDVVCILQQNQLIEIGHTAITSAFDLNFRNQLHSDKEMIASPSQTRGARVDKCSGAASGP